MITPARLNTFLEVLRKQSEEEWDGVRHSGNYWVVEYKASYPPFRFYVEYNEEMLFVQCLLDDYRLSPASLAATTYLLLRLNEEISLVKFGLTADGTICLMGELPAKAFSLDSFENLLRLMVHYLERHYWEIGVVAESPAVAASIAGRSTLLPALDQQIEGLVRAIQVLDVVDDPSAGIRIDVLPASL